MELSEKQLAANRANAIKSKVPVTPHGNRMSSRNGTKHGVLASVLLAEGESRERFATLMNGLYAENKPVTPIEIGYVNKIGVAQWRQESARANEAASQTSADPTTRAIGDHSHPLGIMRQYRALEALSRLRDRQNNQENAPPNRLKECQKNEKNKKCRAIPVNPSRINKSPRAPIPSEPSPNPPNDPLDPIKWLRGGQTVLNSPFGAN
jgi:hypothetical protein